MKTGVVSKADREKIRAKNFGKTYQSRFNFVNAHNGLRRGELTAVISPKGMGKSGFVKTLVLDLMQSRVNILIVLSEETVENYRSAISDFFYSLGLDESQANQFLSRLYFIELVVWEDDKCNYNELMCSIEEVVLEKKIDAVFFDNYTTSFLGEEHISQQSKSIRAIAKMIAHHNIIGLVVFHTAKKTNVYQEILDGESIRGSGTSTNVAGYIYVLTTFFKCTPPRTFVSIDKARWHNRAHQTTWELQYDTNTNLFVADTKSKEDVLRSIMNSVKKKESKLNTELEAPNW